MTDFEQFYQDLKKVEEKDSVLTSDQQITRLLKPGSTYLNLNPFEVLQIDAECTIEEAKKRYKRLSILVHPDKNPDDKDRAQRAFDILKRAITVLEDPDEMSRCKEVYVEARARLAIVMGEKKRKLRKEGKEETIEEDDEEGYKKALWVTVTKVSKNKFGIVLLFRYLLIVRRSAELSKRDNVMRKEEWPKNYRKRPKRGSWKRSTRRTTKRPEMNVEVLGGTSWRRKKRSFPLTEEQTSDR